MPTPYAGGQNIDMSDAPGGDFNLDDLFPNPEVPAPATPEPEPQVPETPTDQEFLKTPTGTVYKTKEAAIEGLTHKDEIISRLRAKYQQDYGVDPLDTNARPTTPPVARPQAEPDYANDPLAFWNAQAKAIKDNDPVAYQQVLDKWFQARTAPFLPAVQYGAVQQALDAVSTEIPGYREFRQSNDFNATLEANPILKNAVTSSESNVQYSGQLPDLYRLVYLANQGRKAAEIARSAPAPAPAQPVRPTTSPSTPNPPMAGSARPDLTSVEGRKAIIESAERKGLADAVWGNVGF